MNILTFAKSKFGLLLLSTILSAVLLIGVFEIAKNIQYYLWKANFDNRGWLGNVTIPSANPVLMWEYRPYGKFKQIETNRYGFRDLDYESTAKPDNTFRIAFAGDSVTLGFDVTLEQTFVRQFEIEANKKESQFRIQALNFAVDGYNTLQIYEMIRTKGLKFAPDKVVYIMCVNDFDFNESSGDKILYFRKPKSFFLQAIEKTYRQLFGIEFHQYHFIKNKKVVFQKIIDMRDLLGQEGISFQVIILPLFTANFDNYPLRDMHEEIGKFLKENDVQFLDLLEDFIESGESPRYYSLDLWHPNPKGHKFIAERLFPSVILD